MARPRGLRATIAGPSLLVASSVLLAATGYATQALLARLLEPTEYGRFALALSASTATAVLLTSGVPLAASRRIAASPGSAAAIERRARLMQWGLAGIVVGAFILAGVVWATAVGRADLHVPLVVSSGILATYAFAGYNWNVLIGHGRQVPQAVTSMAGSVAKMVAAFGLAAAGLGAAGALAGYAVAALVQGGLAMLVHRRIAHRPAADASGGAAHPADGLVREAAHGLGLSVGLAFLPSLDLLVATSAFPSAQVGAYATASTAARLLAMISAGLVLFLFPLAAGPRMPGGRLDPALRLAFAALPALMLGFSLGLHALRDPFIALVFGPGYEAARPLLAILAWAGAATAALAVQGNLMFAAGRGAAATTVLAATVAADLALGAGLARPLGLAGPAWAALAASSAGLVAMLALGRDSLPGAWAPWARAIGLALPAVGLLALAEREAPDVAPAAGAVLAAALFGGLAWLESRPATRELRSGGR